MKNKRHLTRRTFLRTSAAAIAAPQLGAVPQKDFHQASGVRVGEVSGTTAIVWTRLTRHAVRNNDGIVIPERKKGEKQPWPPPPAPPAHEIEGACPPMSGRVRVRYGLKADLSDAVETPWVDVSAEKDGIHHFKLASLKPGSTYHYTSETAGADGAVHEGLTGKFHTAPDHASPSTIRFCVMTCQGYPDRDHKDGHPIYPSMTALDPRFIVMTGDLVYYDNDTPRAVNPSLARLHWERMFSLPRLHEALRGTSIYWLKDDHDTLSDDCWPGMKDGELTFAEGIQIFREQAPLGESDYRTIRWGRDLQVWFTEGRDFRSPNKMEDGPEKTIWGAEQKAWFKRTVKESNATWKVLVSPTPLVGPDRKNKHDNHSNESFAHEGNEIREWIKANVPEHFFVVTGDRHWQYHSMHPETGVQEFSVGPASNAHASGTPGENKLYHRFHKVQGGFLCVELKTEGGTSEIAFQLCNVKGDVSYEAKFSRAVA